MGEGETPLSAIGNSSQKIYDCFLREGNGKMGMTFQGQGWLKFAQTFWTQKPVQREHWRKAPSLL
jgi:hypothetical protein